jgi:hypothetical protein
MVALFILGFRCETISSTNPTAAKPKRAAQSGKSCLRYAKTDLARKIPVHTANPAEKDLIDSPACRDPAAPNVVNPQGAGNAVVVENGRSLALSSMAENSCSEPQSEQNR